MAPPIGLAILGAALFGFATLIAATSLSSRLAPSSAGSLARVHIIGLVAVCQLVVTFQILGLLGLLNFPAVLSVQLAIALLEWKWFGIQWPHLDLDSIPKWCLPVGLGLTAFAILFALSGPFPVADSIRYHVPNAAAALQTGSLHSLPYTDPGDNSGGEPSNGELLVLGALLPFHSQVAALIPNVLMLWLVAIAVAHAVKLLGASNRRAAIAAALTVLFPVLWATSVPTAYTDALVVFGFVSACVFGCLYSRDGKGSEMLRMALAGASLGLAAGSKVSALVPCALLALVIIATSKRRVRALLVLAGSSALLAAFWYARAWIIAGNPIFPTPVKFLGHSIFPGLSGAEWPLANYQASIFDALTGDSHSATFSQWLSFIVYLGGFVLAMMAATLFIRRNHQGKSRVLLVALWLAVLAYVFTPFTASTQNAILNTAPRYALPAFALGIILFCANARGRLFFTLVAASFGLAAVVDLSEMVTWSLSTTIYASVIGALVLLLTFGARRVALPRWNITRYSAMSVAVLACAAVAGVTQLIYQPPPPTQLERLVAAHPGGKVMLFDVQNVEAVMGPRLDVPLLAPGRGPQGAQAPILNGPDLIRAMRATGAIAYVIGDDGLYNIYPPDLKIPSDWREIGKIAGATIYVPTT